MITPVGKGMFIWRGVNCAKGNVPVAVALCKSSGIAWVAVKMLDGIFPYESTWLDMAIAEFRNAGIQVWGWQYIYGQNPAGEASAAKKIIAKYKPDGFIIDAEGEFTYNLQVLRATDYLNVLGHPVPLGLTSYRFPSLHPEFPWNVFEDRVDVGFPQVYWQPTRGTTLGVLPETRRSLIEYKKVGYNDIVPIGRAYIGDGHPAPTEGEIAAFLSEVKTQNCPAAGFWALDFIYIHVGGPKRMEAISQFIWADTLPPAPPDTKPQAYKVTAFNLRVRNAPGMDSPTVRWLWHGDQVEVLSVRDYGTVGIWAQLTPNEWVAISWRGRIYMQPV